MSCPAPTVSILLITFNHESYIDQALASITSQVYEDTVEIVVADDASTDGTLERIHAWALVQQDRFAINFLESNGNLGITKNYRRGFEACGGRYVAILEGDDYWTSSHKLKIQIEFLNEHLECNLCSANYFVYDEDSARFTPRTEITEGHVLLSARQLIADNTVGNFSACMYRRDALAKLPPKLFEIKSYDWIVNICIARNSLIGYLHKPLSVYRIHSGGAWSSSSARAKTLAQRDAIDGYDTLTDGLFANEFSELKKQLEFIIEEPAVTTVHVTGIGEAEITAVSRHHNWKRHLRSVVPPFLVWIIHWLIPPIALQFARRLLKGKGSQ